MQNESYFQNILGFVPLIGPFFGKLLHLFFKKVIELFRIKSKMLRYCIFVHYSHNSPVKRIRMVTPAVVTLLSEAVFFSHLKKFLCEIKSYSIDGKAALKKKKSYVQSKRFHLQNESIPK